MAAVEVTDVSKRYGDFKLEKIDWKLDLGKVYGILGPSGSGKSILLDIISGYIKPDSGSVRVLGKIDGFEKDVGFVPQEPSFYPNLSVWENILYFGSLYGLSKKSIEKIGNNFLDYMELSSKKKSIASTLSGGQQKRLNIILSLLHEPKIILLDEPTDQLDPMTREEIWEIINEFKSQNFIVIMTSHLMREIELLCDEILVLSEGKKIAAGKLDDLMRIYHPESQVVLKTKPANPEVYERLKQKAREWPVDQVVYRRDRLVVITHDPDSIEGKLIRFLETNGEEIVEITTKKPDLEDIFMAMTGKKGMILDKQIL